MKIYLRTRGKQEDYQWINADGLNGTPEEWWGNNFKDLSRFEKPTVIVTRNNQSLKILITAITSKRKDELSGTLLRNSIDMVFEDLSSVPQEIRKSLFMIVFSRLCNIKNICEGADSLKSCFSEYFDEILPEDLIESIFAGTFNGKIKIDVKDLAMRCDTLPVTGGERKIELTYAEDIELIGLGSARTKTQDSYASNITHLYRGRALAVFRGTVEISKLMII